MVAIITQISEMLQGSGQEDGSQEAAASEFDGSLLHKCPECNDVHLSEGPRTCSTCGNETLPVHPGE